MSRYGGFRHGWKHYIKKWTSLRTSSASSTNPPTAVTELDYTKAGGIWNLDATVQFRGEPALYEFTSHTFKSIVARGSPTGPTLAQMRSAYSGLAWAQDDNYFTSVTNGFQRWTVPQTGFYSISLGGAAGGDGLTGYAGNSTITSNLTRGALLDGIQIKLYSGDKLDIVVGVKGGSSGGAHGNENGGGGGTWIYKSTVVGGASGLLLVAGGGGGNPSATYGTSCSRSVSYGHGQTTQYSGNPGNCNGTPSIPSVGYGGTTRGGYQGGAGGGYNSDGATGGQHCAFAYGGQSYFNGLVGGTGNTCYDADNAGGFGGGGGGQLGGPGGGGGYTGGSTNGGWSSYSTYGGGGGSYIVTHTDVTSNGTATVGGNTYNYGGYPCSGFVTITKL